VLTTVADVLRDQPSWSSPRLGDIFAIVLQVHAITHHRLVEGKLGSSELDTWIFNLLYGHHSMGGQEASLKFTGYGPWKTWKLVSKFARMDTT
jgi:hypothetical protein